jgi:hypothetical protein
MMSARNQYSDGHGQVKGASAASGVRLGCADDQPKILVQELKGDCLGNIAREASGNKIT